MGEEEIKLLREILAELKANGEATKNFRAEVQQSTANQQAEWRKVVQGQADFRGRLVAVGGVFVFVGLVALGFVLWIVTFIRP